MASRLEDAFGKGGRKFADALRRLLPLATLGSGPEADRARRILQAEADDLARQLGAAGSKWASSSARSEVLKGQREIASQLGIKFGGANLPLITKLANQNWELVKGPADSPRAFLNKALRDSQAVAAERAESWGQIDITDSALNESLIRSAFRGSSPPQQARDLLKDLGLEKGDRILLSNGQQWEAQAYARLLSRTREMEALNLAKADALDQAGFEFIETSEHSGVPDDDICSLLQGRVWALKENSLGIPVLPPEWGLPPWHPNCAHTFGAWIPELNGGQRAVTKILKSHEDLADRLADF
jgi:hypothetical protein